MENSKKLLGYDEQKLQQNIFNKLNKYSKYKLRVKELETNTNEMKQLKEKTLENKDLQVKREELEVINKKLKMDMQKENIEKDI